MTELIKYRNNPILVKEDVPFSVNSIFNPAAIKYDDKYLLLCRVELPIGRSSFVIAESKNGYDFKVADTPCLTSDDHGDYKEYVTWGIEDPRVTKIDDSWYLTYTGYSNYSTLVMLAETNDFKTYIIHGPISEPSNKDCVIFPEKIDGFYWKLDRPTAEKRKDIWISKSPDLIHWGEFKMLLAPNPGTWETDRIGASTPPVKTSEGWLLLFHGSRNFGNGAIYKLGALLLDLEKPWIIKGKSNEPILSPDRVYERIGDVNNVVFSNGWIVENKKVKIYYSGADTNICLAETNIDYLLSVCR